MIHAPARATYRRGIRGTGDYLCPRWFHGTDGEPQRRYSVMDRHRHDLGRLAKFKAAVTAHLQALGPAPWLLYLCDVR